MALTKEKLISRLQTQVGLSKQESRSTVERVLDIMKESLAQGEDLLISGQGKYPGYNYYRHAGVSIQGKDKGEAELEDGPIDIRGLKA